VVLPIHVDFVTIILKQLLCCVVIFILLNEFVHIMHWLLQLSNSVIEPLLGSVISIPYDSRNFFFHLSNILLRSWLNVLSRQLGVDLD
jgi:hypothetical protein